MKSALFAAALLVGTAALAQDAQTDATTATGTDTHGTHTTTPQSDPATTGTHATHNMATTQTVTPGNVAPERDARGIPVVSDEATAPTGFNQPPAVGGPAADPSMPPPTQPATENYPACSRTVTDNCVQAYERGAGRPD